MTTRTITVEALAAALALVYGDGHPPLTDHEYGAAAIFAALAAEPAGDGLREALEVIAGISESRVTVEQADALGYLDGYLAATPVGEVAALDVERLADAIVLTGVDDLAGVQSMTLAERIAAAYGGER